MMGFKLAPVSSIGDFEELARVQRDSYENPDCRLIQLLFPQAGPGSDHRDNAIKEAAIRLHSRYAGPPASRWMKAVDEDTGKLLGAALWHVFDHDPYAVVPSVQCTWFAEGEDREVANALMRQFSIPRTTFMRQPHVYVQVCFTSPESRRQGVAKALMDHATQEADAKGYDMYLDATEMGRALYQGHGFVEADMVEFSLDNFPETARVKELRSRLLPFQWWPMYRPRGGQYERDVTILPWEKTK